MVKATETVKDDMTFAEIPPSRNGRKAAPNTFIHAVQRLAGMLAEREAEGHNDSGRAVVHTFADEAALKTGLRQLARAGWLCNVTVQVRVRDDSDPLTVLFWARTRIAKPRKTDK